MITRKTFGDAELPEKIDQAQLQTELNALAGHPVGLAVVWMTDDDGQASTPALVRLEYDAPAEDKLTDKAVQDLLKAHKPDKSEAEKFEEQEAKKKDAADELDNRLLDIEARLAALEKK